MIDINGGLGADEVKKGHIRECKNVARQRMQDSLGGKHVCPFKITSPFLGGRKIDSAEYDLSNPVQCYILNLPIVSVLYFKKFCITGSV